MANRTDPRKRKPFSTSKYQRPGLAEDELQEIKEVFDLFDLNQTGSLTVQELQRDVNEALGRESRDVLNLIRQADMDGSGRIGFDEFLHMCLDTQTSNEETREDFRKVFGLYYDANNGFIGRTLRRQGGMGPRRVMRGGFEAGEGMMLPALIWDSQPPPKYDISVRFPQLQAYFNRKK